MTHRYSGVVGKTFSGDRQKAMTYEGYARILVQECLNEINYRGGVGQAFRTKLMADGSRVVVSVLAELGGTAPIIRTWIESGAESLEIPPLARNYGGFYSITPTREVEPNTPIDEDGTVGFFKFSEDGAVSGWERSSFCVDQFKTEGGHPWETWPLSLMRQRGSQYSGEMRKVIQLLQGDAEEIPYAYGYAKTHGIYNPSGTNPWVIEISQSGVSAWALPTDTTGARNHGDLEYAPLPVTTLPLTSARRWLLDSETMRQFYEGVALSGDIGWAFSASGRAAQHVCLKNEEFNGITYRKGCLYGLTFTEDESGAPVSADLSLLASDWAWSNHATCQVLAPITTIYGPGFLRIPFFDYSPSPYEWPPEDRDFRFPVHVLYVGETPHVIYYNFAREYTHTEPENPNPHHNGAANIGSGPEATGTYVTEGRTTYRGARLEGVPGVNDARYNRVSRRYPRVETVSFPAGGSPVLVASSYFALSSGVATLDVSASYYDIDLYSFALIIPHFDRDAFYVYERYHTSRGKPSTAKKTAFVIGPPRLYMIDANSGLGRIGMHCGDDKIVWGSGLEPQIRWDNPIWTTGGGYHASLPKREETTCPFSANKFVPLVSHLQGKAGFATTNTSTPAPDPTVNTTSTLTLFSGFDGRLRTVSLPNPGEMFADPLPLPEEYAGSPEWMGVWVDVFTGNGFASSGLELGNGAKQTLGSLGSYSGVDDTTPSAHYNSGWFGVPFPLT